MRRSGRSKATQQNQPERRLRAKSELLLSGSRRKRILEQLRCWARALTRDVVAISIAARDGRIPWYVRAVAVVVAAYALSPIDLIPDFIPVFGYLDDLVIVPLGI